MSSKILGLNVECSENRQALIFRLISERSLKSEKAVNLFLTAKLC